MSMDIKDLRELADEWQELIDDQEIELEAELATVTPDPRFPRLSRALQERAIELAFAEPAPEIAAFYELCDDLGLDHDPDSLRHYGDNYEMTLIAEDDFEEYAQDLAEDLGAIDSNAGWPARCIDWAQAARELKYDYSTVTYDGTDYLIRSC